MRQLLALALILTLLTGCTSKVPATEPAGGLSKYQRECYDVFDTVTVVVAYAGSQAEFDRYYDVIYNELLRLHRLFDIYHSYDGIQNLKTVNDHAGIGPVVVDGELIDLLTLAREAYDRSGGAVNIAMGSLLRLWHDARTAGKQAPETAALPSLESLEAAAEHMDIADMVLDPAAGTVFLADPEMSLDVGAFAKGYAVQRAAAEARAAGLTSGFLNAGGNICVIGSPADGRSAWSVGVQDPNPPDGGTRPVFDAITAVDLAVVTSGSYERFFTVDGVDYHHIIDPSTWMPAERYRAVTVLHPDSGIAELLSTPLFILPYEDGLNLLEGYGGEAIWILQDGSVRTTEGYRARSANYQEGD